VAAEFDRYADRYEELIERSIGFSGQNHAFFLEARARSLLALVRRRLGEPERVKALDVGCGTALGHRYLTSLGRLEGVDVSEAMVATARRQNPDVRYYVGDGSRLPVDDGTFDLAFTACVLHHVPVAERGPFVRELRRVTRPGGLVVVFEHNPLNPLTRLAVSRCEFDEDAILLSLRETKRHLAGAGLAVAEARYILFFPWHGKLVERAEATLRRLPAGAQYYVAGSA
jgi:SAM-dependent methyltransferase